MSELFDHAFFARLGRIQLASHLRLDRGLSGARKSSARGSSVEFSDFREYLPGDDIRRIDWNAYGRLDRLYIKQFMEEKEAFYHVLVDNSASMDFGQEKKLVMALRLAAVFAYLVQQQLDRVEIVTGHDGRLDRLSPVTGRSGFGRLLQELEAVKFAGSTQLNESVRRLSLNGRGICILLSDFLDPQGIDEAVKYLVYKGQEVLLIQVLAREEVDFAEEGSLALTDLESGQEVRVTMTRQTLETYQNTLRKYNEGIEALARRYGCSYLQVVSDSSLEQVIFETLQKRGIFS